MSKRTRASIHNLTWEQLQALDYASSEALETMNMFDSRREAMTLAREKVREVIRTMDR